ncbi:MAG: hypothetical protein ABI478_03395 [Propionivibrio sp.]
MSDLFSPVRAMALVLLVAVTSATAADPAPLVIRPTRSATAPDSRELQNALQKLSWPQFRAVVEAVPKLKADVEAYGQVGWQIVKDNYRVYPWKRSIDKLDIGQKKELADLIERAGRGH